MNNLRKSKLPDSIDLLSVRELRCVNNLRTIFIKNKINFIFTMGLSNRINFIFTMGLSNKINFIITMGLSN